MLPSVCNQCDTLHSQYPVNMGISSPRIPANSAIPVDTNIPEPHKIGAFFDIDNTIMRGASIFHLAKGLFARKILSATDLANFAIAQGKFLTIGSENLADMARITEDALSFVTGRTTEEVIGLSEEIYDEIMADKVWPGTVQLAHTHRAAGHQVWLVSAAPIELANIIATRLGLSQSLIQILS